MTNAYIASIARRVAAPLATLISVFGLLSGALLLPATAFASVLAPTPATTFVVNEASLSSTGASGWFFLNDDAPDFDIDNSVGSFVTGPATAPAGTGSAQISVPKGSGYALDTLQFVGTKLSAIKTLEYHTYKTQGDSDLDLALQFDINSDVTNPANTAYQGRLVFEPYLSGGNVQNNVWQTWEPTFENTTGPGNWWFSNGTLASESGCSQATPCTWSEVKAAFPNAGIRGSTLFKGGTWSSDFTGNVDKFLFGTTTATDEFDFEPTAAVTPSTVTVTIDKFIDGKMATDATANNNAFPMMSTWVTTNFASGSGTYPLGPTGFNSSNAYEAVTAEQNLGSSYTTNEDTTGSIVGPDCTTGDPYALVGYSTGPTEAAAASSTVSLTPIALTNLQSSQYIIVWNKPCLPAPVLVSPASGSTSTSAALTSIDWTDVTDGIGPITYEYESSLSNATNADGSFASPVFQSGTLTDSQISTGGTADGVYYFHMKAMDADGNTSPWSTTYTVTVADASTTPPADTTAPSVPTNLSFADPDAVACGSTTDLPNGTSLWDASTDDTGVTGYDYWVITPGSNNASNPFITQTTTNSQGGNFNQGDGVYTFKVDAFDAAGNHSAYSDTCSITYDGPTDNGGGVTPPPATPSSITNAATGVTASDATLNGADGPVDAQGHSFWVSTAPFDTSSPNIPANVYSTPDMGAILANTPFTSQLTSLNTDAVTTGGATGVNLPPITASTTYYYVAWDMVNGTWYPGAELNFTTSASGGNDQSDTLTATPLNVSTPEDTALLITLNATGGDGSALTFNYTQPAAGGGVVTGTGPEVTYTPAASSTAPDSFTYIVSDDNSTSTPAEVNVTIGGDSDGGGTPPPSGGPTVTNGSTDISENAVNAAIPLTSSVMGAVTFNIVTQTTHGTLSVPANGQVLYTPNKNYTGSDSFQFDASDADGTGNTATYTIMVTEGTQIVPTATPQSVTVTEGGSVGITLGATDADAEDSFTFATTSSPTSGTLTGTGADLTYTPNAGFTGADSFKFTASDETSTSSEATVSITVNAPQQQQQSFSGGGGGGLSGAILHNFTNGGSGGAGGSGGTTGQTGTGTGGQVLGASTYNFTKNFGIGTHDEDVTQLQLILIANGDLKIAAPTGYFGTLTRAAVKKYQAAHNITPVSGYVGPLTRALLNAGSV
jgi:Bacterial Ig domain/Putative peptidoglycan binding domain